MRIALATHGTLGEILPYVALATRLRERGHGVTLAVPVSLTSYAEGFGFPVFPCRPDITPQFVRANAASYSTASSQLPARHQAASRARFEDLSEICRDADALVAAWFPAVSALLRELFRIPWIQGQPTAGTIWHPSHERDFQILESGTAASSENEFLRVMYTEWLAMRDRLGLEPISDLKGYFRPDMLLAGVSPLVFPLPAPATSPEPIFTGFWLRDQRSWRPDEDLARFLARKPIIFSFSSQPMMDSQGVLDLHARAALKLVRPILVLGGWSGISENMLAPDIPRSEIMIRAFEPFQEVARHACCAIIHGGIGTLADGILAGCPLLVEPYGGDQYLNARQVPRLKIGAAADRKQLTEEGLVRLLTERVLLPGVRQRVEALAVEVRKEDGLTCACELIEKRVSERQPLR